MSSAQSGTGGARPLGRRAAAAAARKAAQQESEAAAAQAQRPAAKKETPAQYAARKKREERTAEVAWAVEEFVSAHGLWRAGAEVPVQLGEVGADSPGRPYPLAGAGALSLSTTLGCRVCGVGGSPTPSSTFRLKFTLADVFAGHRPGARAQGSPVPGVGPGGPGGLGGGGGGGSETLEDMMQGVWDGVVRAARPPAAAAGAPSAPRWTLLLQHVHRHGQAPPRPPDLAVLSGTFRAAADGDGDAVVEVNGARHPEGAFWAPFAGGRVPVDSGAANILDGDPVCFMWKTDPIVAAARVAKLSSPDAELPSMDPTTVLSFHAAVGAWSEAEIVNPGFLAFRLGDGELPAKFESMEAYARCYLPFVLEECRASMASSLERAPVTFTAAVASLPPPRTTGWRDLTIAIPPESENANLLFRNDTVVLVAAGSVSCVGFTKHSTERNTVGVMCRPGEELALALSQGDAPVKIKVLVHAATLRRVYDVLLTAPAAVGEVAEQFLRGEGDGVSDSTADVDIPEEGMFGTLAPAQARAAAAFAEECGEWDGGWVRLVQGPPGTGKTTMIVAAIRQFLAENDVDDWECGGEDGEDGPGAAAMVCAPSNKAVQHLCERALAAGVDPKQVVLLSTDDALPALGGALDDVIPSRWRDRITLMTDLEAARDAVSSRIPRLALSRVDSGATLASVLANADIAAELLHEARVVFCTLSVAASSYFLGTRDAQAGFGSRVTHLVVDEAGQALDPEILLPLTFASPKRLLLVGDHRQLPATVSESRFGRSALERLVDGLGCRCEMLDVQHRMHSEICRWPSERFYEGRLSTGAGMDDRAWAGGLEAFGERRVVFVDVKGSECREGTSHANAAECDAVARITAGLGARGCDGRVVTFYRSQYHRLTRAVEDRRRWLVSTVDSCQGTEADVVVISFVRTARAGFLADYRRLNVAVTRARHLLVLVGNLDALEAAGAGPGGGVVASLVQSVRDRGLVVRECDI